MEKLASEETGPGRDALARGPQTGLSVVILEDNRHDAELLRNLLVSAGIDAPFKQCDCASSFEAALSEGCPDLIISDFSLPGYDGRSALSLAHRLHPAAPFIFFSGTLGEESAIEALKEGATDFVLKQRPQRLVAAVRRALSESTERKRMKETEERMLDQAHFLDFATDSILVRDMEDRVQFANKGAEQLFGYSREELIGRRLPEFLPPALLKQYAEAKEETARTGRWTGELAMRAKSMKPILVASRWTLVGSPGQSARILSIDTDITEKKQMEQQFLRAQRLESIGVLASGIAHDLNNILAPITMAVDLLSQGQLSDDDAATVAIIDQSAKRGSEIVKQVLTFVRGTDGNRASLPLGPLIKEFAKIVRETFPRNIRTKVSIEPELWRVNVDPGQTHQILMNLSVNARDAMPDGGTLTFSAQNVTDVSNGRPEVLVTVEDTGTGISPDVIERMFDPFFTTKDAAKGTGLGLSTVLGIVKGSGGRIDVESAVGSGTCFRIFLPAEAAPRSVSEAPAAVPPPRGNGELVLFVDDEPEIRKIAAQTLSRHGYEVITASDGDHGVVRFAAQAAEIRLVVTDIMMPGRDGASFARTIRRIKPEARIIAMTGHTEHRIPDVPILLKKPFLAEELLRAVSEALCGDRAECD